MKKTVIPIVGGALGTVAKGLEKGQEDLEIRVREETIKIIEIGQNTEESPRDLRRLLVTQTDVRNSQGIK